MGLLNNIVTTVAPIAAGLVVSVASNEFLAWAPTWAKRIVARAARHMPEAERTAAEAEWLAHVEQVPGNVAKVYHAFGLWRGAFVSQITVDICYQTFDRYAVPFMLVVSIVSTITDYTRGIPWALLKLDMVPAVASALVTSFYLIGAVRRRRAQKRAAAEALIARVKR